MIGAYEQIEMLKRGVAEIVPEPAFLEKLEGSVATGRPLKVKLGIDPTAQHVTLGWAVVLRKLRQFQDLGHEIILVIGDFTAMIGDPSGRNRTRPRLSEEEVAAYAERCLDQIFLILDRDLTRVVRNSEWLSPIGFERVIEDSSSGSFPVDRSFNPSASPCPGLEYDDFRLKGAGSRNEWPEQVATSPRVCGHSFTVNSKLDRDKCSHPPSVTRTVWPRAIARPLSELSRVGCRKNMLPASISSGFPV